MNRQTAQLCLLGLMVALDQWSKWRIQQPEFQPFVVIDGFFNIVRAYNDGVAFSMFADLPDAWRTGFLIGMTGAIALFVAIWWWRERRQHGPVSWLLVLILAGAVGNLWDRIQLGYVVDFVQWYVVIGGEAHYWPSFNVADICISVSVVLLILLSFRKS